MQKATQPQFATKEQRNTTTFNCCLFSTAVFSLLFVFFLHFTSSHPPQPQPSASLDPFLFPHRQLTTTNSPPYPPSIAYFISGSSNDSHRILRLLFSVYHPKNQYLLHLDLSASQSDRDFLALKIQSVPVFRAAQNVNVIGKANFVYPKGSSSISNTLHGAAILLKVSPDWDWFINLSAADYPLVTQDDLLHIFSYLPKNLNFVNHTSYIGWRESRRYRRVIVDPGLYLSEQSEMLYGTQKRELPDAYRLFTGSPFAVLSRNFMEFCILGTENLPRTLLMYLANTPSSQSLYFPTILCNSPQLNRTIMNHNLLFSTFSDYDAKRESRLSNPNDFEEMIRSGAAFASPFLHDDPILDRIDQEVLGREPGQPGPGGWCLGMPGNGSCYIWGAADILRPGPGAKRLETRVVGLLSNGMIESSRCAYE